MKENFIRNLLIGFGISFILLVFTSIASYTSISNLLESQQMVTHTNEVIAELENILSTAKDAETGQRGFLLTGDNVFLDPYNGSFAKIQVSIANVKRMTSDNPAQQKSLADIDQMMSQRFAYLDALIVEKRKSMPITMQKLLEGKNAMDQVRGMIKIMEERENQLLADRTGKMNKFAASTPVLILITALLSFIVTLYSFIRVQRDFKKRAELQQALIKKDKDITNRIEIIEDIADKVATGNYDVRVDDVQKDTLGSLALSLNKMAESLQYSFKVLADKEWLQTGVAQLNVAMVGDQQLNSLSLKVTEFIAGYIHCYAGALYISEGSSTLHLYGSFALDPRNRKEVIVKGEGLVGQCAESGKEIILSNLPSGEERYISFTSGTIKAPHVVIFPLFHEAELKGVIELASLTPFSESDLTFLHESTASVGAAINSAVNRKKLQELLEETQSQAEELQAQQEELENLNTELESQTQKLQASEEELKVQQEELVQSNHELSERSKQLEQKNEYIQEKNSEIQKKAEELSLSTRYKSEFLANMSHELRTPLNSILLLSRLMAENKDHLLNDEQVSYAQVIRSSGEGLLTLINEILDLSKIESGKMELEFADILINEIVKELHNLFAPVATEKKIELLTNVSPGVPSLIHTDKTRLEQILRNLLSNAIKFTEQGNVRLSINVNRNDSSMLDFVVEDTGIGIATAKQSMVFEAFQQADGSTRRKYGGTGLGLSISREIAKLLGGTISLQSEEGKGSVFTVTLPFNASNSSATVVDSSIPLAPVEKMVRYTVKETPVPIPDDRANMQEGDKFILIVEDDTNFANILLDFTHKKGYKGLVAVSGDQGIALAKQYKPLAILLDIMLPIKDGWEVMEELKADPETRHIPVHIMSVLQLKKEGLKKGAIDFINKPVALDQMNEIFTKLENALKNDNKKVLIVEENTKHAEALSYFLDSFQIKSDIKHNINDSIAALQDQQANCVILDMGIPDQKAYETLEMVRKNPGLENIPIIVFTGKNLSLPEENRLKKYADSIVIKTAHSYQRILDEVTLFLHLVSNKKNTPIQDSLLSKNWELNDILEGKTVMVVDDDIRNVFSITKILEQYKMNVISATDGKESLRLLEENPNIDIILTDIMMPEMDGFETIKRIRQNPLFKKLPVLAVTAKAMVGDREKCIQAGASDYISKPIDMDQLISLLRVWLYDNKK